MIDEFQTRITAFRAPEDSSVRVHLQNLMVDFWPAHYRRSGEALGEPPSVLETNFREASVGKGLPARPGTASGSVRSTGALSLHSGSTFPACFSALQPLPIGLLSSSRLQLCFPLPSLFGLLPQPLVLVYVSMCHHKRPSWCPFV